MAVTGTTPINLPDLDAERRSERSMPLSRASDARGIVVTTPKREGIWNSG
jgi:hypothetical protein